MGKIEESCLNKVKKYCLLNETYYSGITEEEKKSLIALIKTAKDTDGKTTTFPDFIGENGWIEHFKVTSSQSSKKGYESDINHAEMKRSIKQQIDEAKQSGNCTNYQFSASTVRQNDNIENYRKSLMTGWKKHYKSYEKKRQELKNLKIGVFLIDSDDIFLPYIKFNDMRNGIIEDDNLPFEIVHDKEIMDFIQQYQADIQYVIFVSKMVVKILITSSIPDILTEKNYQNFATLPVIGLTIKYGGGGSISF